MIPPLPHDTTTLVLRHVFPASRLRVFRAWIEPEALEQWFKPLGMHITVRSLDAHVGGSFCFDGEDGSSTVGTYLHIIPPEKLVFTWLGAVTQGKETIVTLDFLDKGLLTEVVLTHERLDTPKAHAQFSTGWQSVLDSLDSMLSTHSDS